MSEPVKSKPRNSSYIFGEQTQKLSQARREEWLSNIARDDIKPSSYDNLRICSDHFINEPANLYDQLNPDWAPTVMMGHTRLIKTPTPSKCRYSRSLNRSVKEQRTVGAMTLLELSSSTNTEEEEGISGGGPDSGSSVSSSSTSSSMKFITNGLKPEGRTRLLILGLLLLVVVVVVAAVVTAVVLSNAERTDTPRTLKQLGEDQDSTLPTTTIKMSASFGTSTRANNLTIDAITTEDRGLTISTTSFPVTTVIADKNTTISLPETPPPLVDHSEPSNASVSLSDIYYHPEDVKSLTMKCQGRHLGNWNTLTVRRQFKDSYEPIAAAAKNENDSAVVVVFYPNVTHSLIVLNYELTLIITLEDFYCEQLTNFTCSMDTDEGIVASGANISVFMPGIEIKLPHSVVEDLLLTLQCTLEIFDMPNTTIVWKFKPESSDSYMDFSVSPVTNVTKKSPCTYLLNSTLSFTPTMYENGSMFRCEISTPWWNPVINQDKTAEIMLQILPRSFCDDKRQFSLHPHPNEPCSRVVYCLNTGPLVYEIECEPGYCYDTTAITCVLQDEM